MIKIGIIGYGYWGVNLLRTFFNTEGCLVSKVADLRKERLELVKKIYPTVEVSLKPSDIINDKNIDAVVLATPVFLHYSLSKNCLEKGKHVLVEKPMTGSVSQAKKLISLAKRKRKILMVDHTFLYSPAVQKIKTLMDNGQIGKIQYFDSTRINLGLFQSDINVLWDLAPHDISILCYLLEEEPATVQATGVSHTKNALENIAYLILKYNSGIIAHISCSWSSPVKIRFTIIGGDKKMIKYDDLEPAEKIKIYDTGDSVDTGEKRRNALVSYRIGDVFVPKIADAEPLKNMANDFINSIETKNNPVSGCKIGLRVVRILELSQKSIKNGSKEVAYRK
jgi:predicted dehydrogenase